MAIVPCDGADQAEVATLLLAMAREKGIPTGTIRVTWDGFDVPDELLATEDRIVLSVPEPRDEDEGPTEGDLIRAWARENGYVVADRGAIKKIVIAAYREAHDETVDGDHQKIREG